LKKESEINDGNSTIRIIKTVKRRGGGGWCGGRREDAVSLYAVGVCPTTTTPIHPKSRLAGN